jgi:hypothetical protein
MAAAIKIDTFGGMLPAVDDRLLPDKAAAHSENVWLYSGRLAGIPQNTLLRACSNGTKKVFRIPADYANSGTLDNTDAAWLEFTDVDTDVIRSPVIDDDYDRYYWASSSAAPKYNTKARIENVQLNDEYTKVLLHFDGADAATTITDTNLGGSAHTWTANGNAQLDTAIKKFGTAALLCDGTGDYVSTPDHADFNLGSGDFTIDCWFNCTGLTGVQSSLAGQCDAAAADLSFFIDRRDGGTDAIRFFATGVGLESTTAFNDATNAGWHHLAIVRSGDAYTMYIDGVAEDTATASGSLTNSASILAVGQAGAFPAPWFGSIDEFRLSVGIARWTADFDVPTVAYSSDEPWLLGIPAPSVVPAVSPSGGSGADSTRSYVYTWVSAYGEEGPPSEPTTVTSYAGVATYFFVAEQAISDTTYDDVLSDDTVSLNDQLESTNWSAPPSDLEGWVRMPNGIIAGWRESEIWFSEPYRPHAWPAAYVVTVDYPVVGLGVTGQTLIICTRGYPQTASGVHPSTMAIGTSSSFEPCLSRGSVVSLSDGVYYASPNGLVFAGGGQFKNISRKLIHRDRWQNIAGVSTLRAASIGTAYMGFGGITDGVFQEDAVQTDSFQQTDYGDSYAGMYIDFADERIAFNFLSDPTPVAGLQNDSWTGEVLLIQDDNLYRINFTERDPTPRIYLWRSKVFQYAFPVNLGAMKVYFEIPDEAPTTPITAPEANREVEFPELPDGSLYGVVRLYADGEVVWTRNLEASGELLKLPSGYKANFFQIEFETYVNIFNVQVARTAKELTGV